MVKQSVVRIGPETGTGFNNLFVGSKLFNRFVSLPKKYPPAKQVSGHDFSRAVNAFD